MNHNYIFNETSTEPVLLWSKEKGLFLKELRTIKPAKSLLEQWPELQFALIYRKNEEKMPWSVLEVSTGCALIKSRTKRNALTKSAILRHYTIEKIAFRVVRRVRLLLGRFYGDPRIPILDPKVLAWAAAYRLTGQFVND